MTGSNVDDEIVDLLVADTPPERSGDYIKANLDPVRKTHKVKKHLAKAIRDGRVTIETADTSTPFRNWSKDTYEDV